MSGIESLGYIGVHSDRLDEWSKFASHQLGMQTVDTSTNTASFRMDHNRQRFVVTGQKGDSLAFLGWEVATSDDLADITGRLDAANVEVHHAPAALADQRFVHELVTFDDPVGNRIELFCQPEVADEPFTPGRPHSGFVTGALGLGHAVLHVTDPTALVPFYRDLLGFGLSDFGLDPVPMYFFHVNERHHSFALIGSSRVGFHHFMIEYGTMDDVGQGYDLANAGDHQVAYTLGRHTNDWMTSFYSHTPSDFFVETGWGGRVITPETWEPVQTDTGPSFWGHDRLYLPTEERARFAQMRLDLAASGRQGPTLDECPWLLDGFGTAR